MLSCPWLYDRDSLILEKGDSPLFIEITDIGTQMRSYADANDKYISKNNTNTILTLIAYLIITIYLILRN